MQKNTCWVMGLVLAVAIWLGAAATVSAQEFTWTGQGVDNKWTTGDNWTGTGYPATTSHDAIFTNQTDLAVDVDADITIRYLRPRQAKDVTNTYTIAAGKTFAPYYFHAYNETYENTVVVQGGTFKPRTTLFVAYQDAAAGSARFPVVNLILTNTVFDTGNLTGGIHLGRNIWSIGSIRGELDARGADIRHNGVPDILNVNQLWIAVNRVNNCNRAQLLLPPSLTNITVNSLIMRGISDLDLGDQPQLETLAIANEALIGRGYITYRDGDGNTHTNLPPNVELKIGAPGSPAAFDFGEMYNVSLNMRWGGFRRFEGYFSRIHIGRSENSGTAVAELDLATVGELAGDITAQQVETPILRMGGGPFVGTGILRLPGTVTNMTFDTFELGNASGGLSAPVYSVLHLGSNTQLRTITVKDNFIIGRGRFEYTEADGTPRTGLPGGVNFQLGAPNRRAGFRVGNNSAGGVYLFGPGLSSFEGWLSELRVGAPVAGWFGHYTDSTLDLRNVVVGALDVENTVTLGPSYLHKSTFFLSSAAMQCADLNIGGAANNHDPANHASELILSNAVVTVTNSVTIGQTGKIVATLNGYSSGIDLLTDDLSLADEHATHTQWRGWIDLTFAGDPLMPLDDYFGLRMQGDAVAFLQGLTNATPARLTWNIDGLSPRYQERFGIHYHEGRDMTIVGVERMLRGTLIKIR